MYNLDEFDHDLSGMIFVPDSAIRQFGRVPFWMAKQRYDGGITGDIIAIYMRYHELLVIIYIYM